MGGLCSVKVNKYSHSGDAGLDVPRRTWDNTSIVNIGVPRGTPNLGM